MNKVEVVNILGFGVMGRQIAALLQLAGYHVCVWDRSLNDNKISRFKRDFKMIAKAFSLENIDCKDVSFVNNLGCLAGGLTYEVLVEDIGIKRAVLASLPSVIQSGTLLTNTSSYSPLEIHERAIGMHFFNPIYSLRFAEISSPVDELSASIKALISKLEKLMGIEFVFAFNNRGYIGNYLLFREIASALKIIDEYHYKTEAIDKVLAHMGRVNSLFDIIDLVGVDVCRKIILNLKEKDNAVYFSPLLDKAISNNIYGKKNKTSIRQILDK